MQPAPSSLSPTQSAALTALLDPAATVAAVARQLNLTIEALVDLMEAPAVRSILDRLIELEELRRRITAAAPISAALRALTKLLDRADVHPAELRRAATTILRHQSPSRERGVSDPGATTRRAATSEHFRSSTAGRASSLPSTPRHLDTSTPSSTSRERERPAAAEPFPDHSATLPLCHSATSSPTPFLPLRPSPTSSLLAAAGSCGPAP